MKEQEIESFEESTFEDFNSDDAFCDDLSSRGGPPEVEILGMELIVDGSDDSPLSGPDDSENDSEEHRFPPTVDSLELARERLSHLVRSGTTRRQRFALPTGGKFTRFRNGEVDSLILTRRNKPHLIHDSIKYNDSMMKRFEKSGGLMYEVDSMVLTRRRLPHLIHKRGRPKCPAVEEEEPISMEDYYEIINDEGDSNSTSTTVSMTSDDSLFTTVTVDSLILARKRLGVESLEEVDTTEEEVEDSIAALPSHKSGNTSKPAEIASTNVTLGGQLRRTSSGACAA